MASAKAKKKIATNEAKVREGADYPAPFAEPCNARRRLELGSAAGLSQFGVNRMTLPPGAWSSQRHWHLAEDEFVYVVEGEVVLITDAGEEQLVAGDSAGFKAGEANGHHFVNRSDRDAILLEIGTASDAFGIDDEIEYSDIDLRKSEIGFTKKSGIPYK